MWPKPSMLQKTILNQFNRNRKLKINFMLRFRIWKKLCNQKRWSRNNLSKRISIVKTSADLWNLWSKTSKAVLMINLQQLLCRAYSTSHFLIVRRRCRLFWRMLQLRWPILLTWLKMFRLIALRTRRSSKILLRMQPSLSLRSLQLTKP